MRRAVSLMRQGGADSTWRAPLAGLCGILVGIGLARFAYTPLIPALIEAGWFTAAEAAYLGAANLAGYSPARCWRGGWQSRHPWPRSCAR